MKLISLALCLLMTSCTYSISMAHTEGTATDVIDETSSATPNIAPVVSIPAAVL